MLIGAWYLQALAVGTAIACGLLIGIERGFTLRSEKEGARVAGVRTFTLIGMASGLSGLISSQGHQLAAGAVVAGAAAVMTIGYAHRVDINDRPDATSPIAAMATIALGFVAGSGNPALAIVGATLVTLVLALKAEVHDFIDRLDQEDVKALARFAVIAGAILPFLPDGQYGPYGAWNPQKLWLVVVLVTGFSFLGYVANRIFGERHGTIATAVIGGLYSSTAVTQSLAQRLGSDQRAGAEPAGIALASAIMYLRVLVLVGLIATRLLVPFALIVAPAVIVAALAGWWLYRSAPHNEGSSAPGNPIALLPALAFLVFVAAAAAAGAWAQGRFGEQGIAVLLLIIGTMDVDVAIVTAGGLRPEMIGATFAALALAGTILANMAVKLGITLAYARSKGKSAALALAASMLALAVSIGITFLSL
ncbi:MgtC/SapB family protein [Sphingomonas daechungensis]|uniref:MgtC/SapB family protein n=1 Tax=Sphingomonas daechungensis TaxID=1176646 RepID=UPI003783ECF4